MYLTEIRFCSDIGMFAFDRPRSTCKHRTKFCMEHCYNGKLYSLYELEGKDKRNEEQWQACSGSELGKTLARKRKQTARFRLATRGESLAGVSDIAKVYKMALSAPDTLIWLPTRAWHKGYILRLLEKFIMPLKNVRLMASIDPSDDIEFVKFIANRGWSTMFFGDDLNHPLQDDYEIHKCAKTFAGIKGACATCTGGCFMEEQVHVWLKEH